MLVARVVKRTDGAIKQKLAVFRRAHLAMGYGDPMHHRPLWAALAGLHRWQGPDKRKKPVAPRILL